jgi:hypothetical protein
VATQRRVGLWIFLFFQALYALTSSGNAFRVPDEFEVYYQVEHLIDGGDLSIPQAVSRKLFFGRVGIDQKPYAPYGPLPAILAVPHHLLARGVAWIARIPRDTLEWTFVVSGLTMLSTSTGAALAVAGFHRAALGLGASGGAALLLSMLLGGASVLWTYGTTFYSEAWQAAALVWAAVCLIQRRIAPASMLLAVCGLIKVTSLVFAPGFVVAVIVDRSFSIEARARAAIALSAGIAAAVAIHVGWNLYRFGNPLEFGYNWAETIPVLPAKAFLLGELPRGLVVLLLSPGKSILLWAPVLVLSVTRLRTCPRPLLIGVATSAICGLVFYGAYLFPEGGYSHGPRHLVPIVPLLLLPAAVPGRPWRRELVTACAALGMGIALLSVSVSFLQDQALGSDFQRVGYYERIDPAAGRPWNRYRMAYVPFMRAATSNDWPASRRVGAGLDFFSLHLLRARDTIPAAQSIPAWLPWALFLSFGGLLIAAASRLWTVPRPVAIGDSPSEGVVTRTNANAVAIPTPFIGAALVALSLVYLLLFVPRGWIPHDEGMIGQSAERVMLGGIPHVNYEEPYTGGLTWMHAAVFKIAGIDLLYLRWLLFAGAALSQLFTYLLLRRYLDPISAGLGVWVALAWSFPNYFAALPSWWVLTCALGCVWAFVRYVETGWLRYAAAAGLFAGISILIKQTGLYVLVALVMALLYGARRQDGESKVFSLRRIVCVAVALAAVGLAIAIMRSRLAIAEMLYLLLPIAACSRLLLMADGGDTSPPSQRGLLAPGIAVAAAALPLVCFAAPYLTGERFAQLLNGLFILPQKRLEFATMQMPPAYWILAGAPFVAMIVAIHGHHRDTMIGPGITRAIWFLAVPLPIVALYDAWSYELIWQAARSFAALLPVAVCGLLLSRRVHDAKQRWLLFGLVSMLAWASLIQFPFSAPIYFCYITPLAVIAAVAVAGSTSGFRQYLGRPAAFLLLMFALFSMNRGYIYNLGFEHDDSYAFTVPLNFERAHINVSAADAVTYHRVMELIATHLDGGALVAGPDCPEVYFLAGQFNPSGTLFEFLGGEVVADEGVRDLPAWASASVIVLNHRRSFSRGLASHLLADIRKAFPNSEGTGSFEVRWR